MTRIFGHIPRYKEGYEFQSRLELSLSGVHPPRWAGISGSQREGADSIVLSGGYEDDEDYGDFIIYTGHGGRDSQTGKQVTDQELVRNNLALAVSCQQGLPVRLIRGATPHSLYAPEEGYRYDGLFRVEDYWKEKGRSGFMVWKFRLRKINAASKSALSIIQDDAENYRLSKRVEATVQRIIRNTEVAQRVKELYQFRCQICDTTILTNAGVYAEAAHIQPLGAPHNGPDVIENILCLCPNHHAMLDYGGFSVLEDFSLIGMAGKLTVHPKHRIGNEYLRYHLTHFYDEKNRI